MSTLIVAFPKIEEAKAVRNRDDASGTGQEKKKASQPAKKEKPAGTKNNR